MQEFVTNKVKNNDEIWVSKDCVDKDTALYLGDYYCINEYGKFEIYEDQVIYNKQLFILMKNTFTENMNRKWYQFWKPKMVIKGYIFKCVDLEET